MGENDHLKLWLQNARFIIFPLLQCNPDEIKAQAEEMSMDGENILKACNLLQIEYAKFSNLNIETQDSNIENDNPVVNVTSHTGQETLGEATTYNQAGHMASVSLNEDLGTGSVLLVSNMDENSTECDHLFVLFGVYGDVQRVKIMFNKKDTALVQMSEPQQALLAMTNLDKTKLWGNVIRVMPSKHTTVKLPKKGQPDTGLTKDYGNSNLHRFKKPGSKNFSNIYAPSSKLHLSNIPTSIKEPELRAVFGTIGLHVHAFKFFQKDKKMALVQLDNVENAIIALIKLHNYQLSETSHLRVSFSKPSTSRRNENEPE